MKKLILILTAAVFAVSCSDNLEDLNQNIKDPTTVSGESLFASAQKQLADQIVTPNVNLNNLRLWTQQLQETTYTDESQYDQITRAIPDNHWREIYRDVLKDLKESARVIEATDNDLTNNLKPNKLAIIEVLNVYAFSNLVETYGDIPYSEALDIDNLLPVYDDGLTVYKDLISRLNAAIGSMNTSVGSFDGSNDLIYGGDVAKWKKFANSLKLRMGIMLSDVDAGLSKSTVESAFSSGVFTSNADNGSYQYSASAPNNNPMNDNLVLSGRNDYVAAVTIIDIMNDLEDPRRPSYFTDVDGEYIGGQIGEISAYPDFSHVADALVDPTAPGVLLSYVEVRFLLAEAAARGYSVGGDAATHYAAAITASFDYWGVSDVASYLGKPEVDYASAIATSSSTPAWKQVIGVQAYLGLYNRTFASYLSIRRLDYPILTQPTDAVSGFPTRYTYPVVEQTLNGANYDAAASAIGGDAPETQLFWDKFYTFDF
ncbi:MAG: SusD/RagB family nutrient-binding outer membrane lipoprotein [Aequorivita sp.]|nr:SusD/RagB family nutrient-binding outer membrane lipoprotein [Aequorivita sp.]|tara:strand:+ start:2962 stop:4419 length:1458 start_codon:yes stop_codon:yes gene_type:complete